MSVWGYTEGYVGSMDCDLKNYWASGTACAALNIDTRPRAYGGPNICYKFQHYNPNMKDPNGVTIPKAAQIYQADGRSYYVGFAF
jgi:hypothetical protein